MTFFGVMTASHHPTCKIQTVQIREIDKVPARRENSGGAVSGHMPILALNWGTITTCTIDILGRFNLREGVVRMATDPSAGSTMRNRGTVVSQLVEPSLAQQPFELAECKGLGHPDVLCDGIAERVSHEYAKWCVAEFGQVLHHNFDKVLLAGEETSVTFGSGAMLAPIRIIVGGRATAAFNGRPIPVESIVTSAVANYLRETVRHLDPSEHCLVQSLVHQSDPQLADLVLHGLANDSISCCAFWPRTPLENTVFESTHYINHELSAALPIGEDVKVSGFRAGQSLTLVISLPFLATETSSLEEYIEYKAQAHKYISQFASSLSECAVDLTLNAADNLASRKVYITLTGTSAENADDGSVGRGNRANGIVAPLRPSSAPPAGKNPLTHPGKLYNFVAMQLAKDIVDRIEEVIECRVLLFIAIGQPLRTPTVMNIGVRTTESVLKSATTQEVVRIAQLSFENIDLARHHLQSPQVRLY